MLLCPDDIHDSNFLIVASSSSVVNSTGMFASDVTVLEKGLTLADYLCATHLSTSEKRPLFKIASGHLGFIVLLLLIWLMVRHDWRDECVKITDFTILVCMTMRTNRSDDVASILSIGIVFWWCAWGGIVVVPTGNVVFVGVALYVFLRRASVAD